MESQLAQWMAEIRSDRGLGHIVFAMHSRMSFAAHVVAASEHLDLFNKMGGIVAVQAALNAFLPSFVESLCGDIYELVMHMQH